jgi:hypothetical protein
MSLHAPQLIDYEMASVALAKARAGLGDIAAQGLADYKVLALERAWVEPVAPADHLRCEACACCATPSGQR